MLIRSAPERALGALFGGESTAGVLHQHLTNLWEQRAAATSSTSPQTSAPAASVTGKRQQTHQPKPKVGLPPLAITPLRKALQSAVKKDIDERTARSHRLNETELAAKILCEPPFLDKIDILSFDDVIRDVLDCTSNVPHFRDEHVQRYAELLSEIDPTLLVAWHLVKQDQQTTLILDQTVKQLTTLFVGPRFFKSHFAEGHIHANGVSGENLVLAQLVLGHQWPPEIRDQHPHANRLRRIRRMLEACVKNWTDWSLGTDARVERETKLLYACLDNAQTLATNTSIDWVVMQTGIDLPIPVTETGQSAALPAAETEQPVSFRWLVRQMVTAAADHDLQHAWIWMFILLWRTYRDKESNITTRAAVLLLVADIMVLRRHLMMDGNGLRRFTDVFHSQLRTAAAFGTWNKTSVTESVQRIFAIPGDQAEIKVSVDALQPHKLDTVQFARAAHARIRGIKKAVASDASDVDHIHSRHHWHFCATFSRAADSSPAALWEQADTLRKSLQSLTPWSLDNEDVHSGHFVLPAELIRGLDVVGDETRNSIEMFAPMLRWLRYEVDAHEPQGIADIVLPRPKAKLHLSVHVGEDYAHPLSGLRHIEETVRFCAMRRGDRLGHALALGIPPEEWLSRHGEVFLSLDDHVDNLIWAWRESLRLKHLKVAMDVSGRLETRIARLLPHVSWYLWSAKTPAPTQADLIRLYRAWRLRRNCSYKVLMQHDPEVVRGSDLKSEAPEAEKILAEWILAKKVGKLVASSPEAIYILRADPSSRPPQLSNKPKRHVRLTVLRHGHVTRRQQQLEASQSAALKDVDYLYDHDDPNDLRFMLALQDACIERYARLGLSIETNPSSNVYIGQLLTHSDHPIYRWDPLRKEDLKEGGRFNEFNLRSRPMPVTINTDDPGMIPTTLRLEHHLMHEGAIDRGHTVKEADEWIERLRLIGLKYFTLAH